MKGVNWVVRVLLLESELGCDARMWCASQIISDVRLVSGQVCTALRYREQPPASSINRSSTWILHALKFRMDKLAPGRKRFFASLGTRQPLATVLVAAAHTRTVVLRCGCLAGKCFNPLQILARPN